MEAIFKLINQQIKTNVPEVRWLDWDLDQLSFDMPPTSFPTVLIDIPVIDMMARGGFQKIGETEIKLTCVFKRLERSHSKTNDNFKDVAFAHFAIINKLIANLEGLENDTISPLTLTRYTRSTSKEHYQYQLYFKTAIYQYSDSIFASRTETLTALPNINVQYDNFKDNEQ